MYNQWALQQVAAIQFAALQLQQQQQQHQILTSPQMSVHLVDGNSDDNVDDDEDDEEKRTLFCANLDERVTEELLYEAFVQAGPIESVRIPKDNVGRQRTFGFVTYIHQCTAPYAMQLYQGLTFFRKPLIIKYQGSSSAQSTPKQRRSLPNDCETYQNRRSGSSSFDNSSLRNSSYVAYNDLSPANPFKGENRLDWTSGGKAKERISKHASAQSRPHQNATPYKRHSGGDERDRGRDQHGNEHQRRYNHSGNNRRSEQRNKNTR